MGYLCLLLVSITPNAIKKNIFKWNLFTFQQTTPIHEGEIRSYGGSLSANSTCSSKTEIKLFNKQNKLKRFFAVKHLACGCIWTLCLGILFIFIHSLFLNYVENNPVTILTFVEQPKQPAPVIVKICNSVFLDPQKILSYNASEINFATYEFLYHAILGNQWDDSKVVIPTTLEDFFLLSSRMLETFKLDQEVFMLNCFTVGDYADCLNHFQWFFDAGSSSCYKAEIDMEGYGTYNVLTFGLYFDPSKTLGKYTSRLGAYVFFPPR